MRNIVGGAAMTIGGIVYAWVAASNHDLGTLRQMGTAMFPVGLGVLLAVLGVAILLPDIIRRGDALPHFSFRAGAVVIASVAVFALTVDRFGLIPSVVASTVVAAYAAPGNRPMTVLLLCVLLSVLAWVVFVLILQMPIPLWQWRP